MTALPLSQTSKCTWEPVERRTIGIAGKAIDFDVAPALGCSIKWKPGA